jgi:iron(III) transport system substrate-binding protein
MSLDSKKVGQVSTTRRQILAGGAAVAASPLFNLTIVGKARAATGKVMFYTTMPTAYASKMAEAFNASHKDLTVEVFFGNGFTLYERVNAEHTAGRVVHDVVMLTDPSLFIQLKKDSRLLNYVSKELEAYPASQRDSDGLWCNGRTTLTIYGYNTRLVKDGSKYKGWADYLDPAFADGRIGLYSAIESGSALQHYYNIRNHKDLGPKWWKELAALKPTMTPGPTPMTRMNLAGQVALAWNNDYNIYEEKNRNKAPLEAVYAKELVTASVIPIGIVKNSPNPEGAKVFYDWWLSKEGQTTLSQVNSIYSPRSDVPPLPGLPKYSELSVAVAPTEELDKYRDELQKEFKELFNL